MTTNYVGKPIKRREDNRFLKGQGKYTDDIKLPGMLHAAFVRTPYAHAKIVSINIVEAHNAPGVIAIYTGEDECADYGVPCGWQVDFKNGDTMKEPPHPLLARGKALHVGENVAVVIGETLHQARDAAELVDVEYEELSSVTNPREAVQDGAPLVHEDAPNNIVFDWEIGNPKDQVDAAMDAAHHITKLDFKNQRLAPNAIEPRSYIADYDSNGDKWTLYTSRQVESPSVFLLSPFVR